MNDPARDPEGETAALRANETFYRALATADAEAMDAIWARSTSVSCLHPGWTLLAGREAVLGSRETILSSPQQPRIVGGGATVTMLGNDVAMVFCREVVSGSALYATNIFVKETGTWRLTHHHSGPVMMQPDP